MDEKYEYKVGNITVESSMSKEEAEEYAKNKLRDTAKDVAVKTVKMAKLFGKAAAESTTSTVDDVKKAIQDAKPVVEKAIEDAKPVVEKGVKELGNFFNEVKEEVEKEEREEKERQEEKEKQEEKEDKAEKEEKEDEEETEEKE